MSVLGIGCCRLGADGVWTPGWSLGPQGLLGNCRQQPVEDAPFGPCWSLRPAGRVAPNTGITTYPVHPGRLFWVLCGSDDP